MSRAEFFQKELNAEANKKLISKRQSFWVKIASWSMVPLIKKGDRLLIKKVDSGILRQGDVICFKKGNFLVTHRIYSINENPKEKQVFVTKSDSKDKLDLPVFPEDVLGKATVLQRRSKKFNLDSKIFKIWGMILIISYQLHPSIPIFINKLTLKILKTGITKDIFGKLKFK